MYALVYGKDGLHNQFKSFTIIHLRDSLQEIAQLRRVSGDLVFDLTTNKIVQDDCWLFDWEKQDATCYARKKIASNAILSGRFRESNVASTLNEALQRTK